MAAPLPPEPLLAEMVREAERVLDTQADSFRQLDGKSQQSIAMGLASLGGLLALTTFAMEKLGASLNWSTWLLFSLAGTFNLAALYLFIDAYIGLKPAKGRQAVVPALDWLQEKSTRPDWTLESHYLSVLSEFPRCYALNQKVIEAKIRRRRQGLKFLFIALVLAAGATLFMMAKRVSGFP